MAMRIVSQSDNTRLTRSSTSSSLEKRAWFMGRFIITSPRLSTFEGPLKLLDSHNEIETVLRLSAKGLSWGKQGYSWWRPWQRPLLPSACLELSALRDIFQEESRPQVLICVENAIRGARDSNHQVYAFRFHDADDASRFQRLFQLLTNAAGEPEADASTTVRLLENNGEERSPNGGRLEVRPSLEKEGEAGKRTEDRGHRIRRGSRRKSGKDSVVVFHPNNNNNNTEKVDDGRSGKPNHQMSRTFSDPTTTTATTKATTTTNLLEFHSPQTIRRNDKAPKTIDGIVAHQVKPETVPIYAVVVAAERTGDERSAVPLNTRKVTSKSWSDDEDAKKTVLDLTWTRNGVFSDMVVSHPAGVVSNNTTEIAVERPTPKPRARKSVQERAVTPIRVKNHVTPERNVTPTPMKNYVLTEHIASPTKVKNHVTPDRNGTPTPMKNYVLTEHITSPNKVKNYVTPERTANKTQVENYAIPERTTSPTQMKTYVTPETTTNPTRVKIYFNPETTTSPTQMKDYVIQESRVSATVLEDYVFTERTVTPTLMRTGAVSSDNTSESTITPIQAKDQIQLEKAITPSSTKGQTPQNVETIPVQASPGLVRVYVSDHQSQVSPHSRGLLKPRKNDLEPDLEKPSADPEQRKKKSLSPVSPHSRGLLKPRKNDLEPEVERTTVDSERRKKSLSFNPSVLVNGTMGDALSETESPDQPSVDVTARRVLPSSHASWSDSEGPERPSSIRKRAMMRGLSLPIGTPASFVAPSTVRFRSTVDTIDGKPHASTNGHPESGANGDHTPLDERQQKFRKVRGVSSSSVPVDVITEEEDRQYDGKQGVVQSTTTHAVTEQSPEQPKGYKKGSKAGAAASSKSYRRKSYFGRKSGEPPLQYASDTEQWTRSKSHAVLGQGTRLGTQVVHQSRSTVTGGGGGHPSMTGKATVTPNGRLEIRINRVRKEDERGTAVQKEDVERGREMHREDARSGREVEREDVRRGREVEREDVRRGRATQVREGRQREVEDNIIRHVPVTHDRHSDPVGRSPHYRRSQSAYDPQRGQQMPVIYNPDVTPPNGYPPGQLVIRSRSATRPIQLLRTVSHDDGTVQLSLPVGQSAGGHQGNGGRKIIRIQQSDLTTQLHNGVVAGRHNRKSNYF